MRALLTNPQVVKHGTGRAFNRVFEGHQAVSVEHGQEVPFCPNASHTGSFKGPSVAVPEGRLPA